MAHYHCSGCSTTALKPLDSGLTPVCIYASLKPLSKISHGNKIRFARV